MSEKIESEKQLKKFQESFLALAFGKIYELFPVRDRSGKVSEVSLVAFVGAGQIIGAICECYKHQGSISADDIRAIFDSLQTETDTHFPEKQNHTAIVVAHFLESAETALNIAITDQPIPGHPSGPSYIVNQRFSSR